MPIVNTPQNSWLITHHLDSAENKPLATRHLEALRSVADQRLSLARVGSVREPVPGNLDRLKPSGLLT
jgi:hypothetical protein